MAARPLTYGEQSLAKLLFGDAIDYARVRIHDRGYFWKFQSRHTAVAPNGQIYFNRGGQWSNPQSTGNLAPQRVAPPAPPASGASAPVAPPVPLREVLPEALRLQITLDGQTLTRDIALAPS